MSWMERSRKRPPLTRDQLLGIANYLTYSRIALVPLVLIAMAGIDDTDPDRIGMNIFLGWLAMLLFTLAGVSDAVDGHYARKYGVVSTYGKFLDPLADKILSISVLIKLVDLDRVSAWITILMVARDVTVTALRSMAAAEGIEISASEWGKKKTFVQSFALGFLIVFYPAFGLNVNGIGQTLLWITLFVSLGSGGHYCWGFFKEILGKKRKEVV